MSVNQGLGKSEKPSWRHYYIAKQLRRVISYARVKLSTRLSLVLDTSDGRALGSPLLQPLVLDPVVHLDRLLDGCDGLVGEVLVFEHCWVGDKSQHA